MGDDIFFDPYHVIIGLHHRPPPVAAEFVSVVTLKKRQTLRQASTFCWRPNKAATCDPENRRECWKKLFVFVSHYWGHDLNLGPCQRETREGACLVFSCNINRWKDRHSHA